MKRGDQGPRCRDVAERLQRVGAVAFFFLAERGLRAAGVVSLPPALVGMALLFAAMVALERADAGMAAALFGALEPGYRFLVKWAALFFLPALVRLPLVEDRFALGVLLRLAFLTLFGFAAQLVATALVASRFPAEQEEDPAEPLAALEQGAAQAAQAVQQREAYPRPGRPFKRRWLPAYSVVMLLAPMVARAGWAPEAAEAAYMICLTLFVLVAANSLGPKARQVAHPILVTLAGSWVGAAAWAALAGPEASFHDVLVRYSTGAGVVLSALLGPLVVALALLLYERRALLQRDFVPILATTSLAAVSGLFGTALLGRLLGLPHVLCVASVSRFVTAPLALVIATSLGASPTFALALGVISGLLGATIGVPLLGLLRLPSARARGLATGASSHVLGTVSLAAADPKAFPYGAVCFVLLGSLSVVLVSLPPVRDALLRVAG